ncbi:hypothetical protein SMQE13_30440 [Serratia marcescens]|nr:hypothetical protein SMQE13_30440 [Serratia marcescens]
MDNKLSEPVAWKLHHHDRYYFEENADVVAIAESMGQAKGDAVYSQEYVSALDKVAQYWIGESAEWKKRAESAEAFRDQMLKYVRTLGSSAISSSVVETILNAAERSKGKK